MDSYNLLIIDDDPNIRKLLNELLAGHPEFRLLIAGDGKEAVRQFAENRIDVVLTDIHMPGFTGLELMADMKKINFKPEILVMTANATPENVETARKIGARSVILKPFDDLEVIEAEINKALQAAKVARGAGNGGPAGGGNGQPRPVAVVAPVPVPAPKAAATPKPKTAPAAKASLWPAPKPGKSQPIAVSAADPIVPDHPGPPNLDNWEGDLTGNETPPAAPPAPQGARQSRQAGPVAHAAQPNPQRRAQPAQQTASHSAPPPRSPAPSVAAPAASRAESDPGIELDEAEPAATPDAADEQVPAIPSDLEAIFRTAASFDTGKMRMQAPIVCLQTWEERGAIAALRGLAARLQREFYVWSAARGLVKDGGQAMGDTYRDAGRALEFIRRQKSNGLYVLADFRPCLDDKTVVRVLREMVMDSETSRLMLVLTAPRLPAPPELAQSCVTFDWPAGGGVDLNGIYQEVIAEVAATTGRIVRLDAPSRERLLASVKDMPAGRARFEIARAIMGTKPQN